MRNCVRSFVARSLTSIFRPHGDLRRALARTGATERPIGHVRRSTRSSVPRLVSRGRTRAPCQSASARRSPTAVIEARVRCTGGPPPTTGRAGRTRLWNSSAARWVPGSLAWRATTLSLHGHPSIVVGQHRCSVTAPRHRVRACAHSRGRRWRRRSRPTRRCGFEGSRLRRR